MRLFSCVGKRGSDFVKKSGRSCEYSKTIWIQFDRASDCFVDQCCDLGVVHGALSSGHAGL